MRLSRLFILAAIGMLTLAAVAAAEPPPVPYGESNAFNVNTNRIGFDDSNVVTLDPTSVTELSSATVLSGAMPNPFNPCTAISFTVASPGRVELGIYDLRGRCLRRLVAEDLVAGPHTRVWDGRTDAGETAASGVYLVRLASGETIHSQKITLVK